MMMSKLKKNLKGLLGFQMLTLTLVRWETISVYVSKHECVKCVVSFFFKHSSDCPSNTFCRKVVQGDEGNYHSTFGLW